MLCMGTPDGIIVLQVLGNLYGLPWSGRNFSKTVDSIVLKLEYKNPPYDPKFLLSGSHTGHISQRRLSLVWSSTFAVRVEFSSSSFRGIKV